MEKSFNHEENILVFEEKINRYMKKRTKLDLNEVYNQTKNQYPVVLTNAYALENGSKDFDEDFQILCGESSAGKFLLYDNGLYIVFDVDKIDGTYLHWHPANIEEAISDVMLFMSGICKH